GSRVRGLAVKGGGALSRKDVDQLAEVTKQLGGAGLAWVKRQGEQISGSVGKHFTAETLGRLGVGDGDVALMTVGPDRITSPVLDKVRQEVIRRLAPRPETAHAFCWVVDFPLFELDPETGRPVFAHHPLDRKSTRLNSSHVSISYAVFCLKKKKKKLIKITPIYT